MRAYQSKIRKLTGTEFREVHRKAFKIYQQIKKRSKRRTYIRSDYFRGEKIFIDIFWQHLFQKQNWKDRIRRLKYFPPAIEVIRHTRFEPRSKENPNQKNEILHRFTGLTAEHEVFYVQIKEDKRSGQKFLISIFPDQ